MNNSTFSTKKIESYRVLNPKDIHVADKEILQDWYCRICDKLVFEPKICDKCGDVFCSDCILKFLKECGNRYKCIKKCQNTSLRHLNVKEKNYINKIKLRCKHDGCDKFIKYTSYKDHLDKCQYRLYQCDNNPCTFQRYYSQMEKHSKNCQYRIVSCTLCNESIKFIDTEKHYKQDCMQAKVECPFCNNFFKRIDFNKTHQSNDAKCLKDLVEFKNKRLKECEAEIKILKNENNNLKKEIQYNKTLIEEKSKKITELTKSKNDLIKKYNDKSKTISDLKEYFNKGFNRLNEDNDESEKVLDINNEVNKNENYSLNTKIEKNSINDYYLYEKKNLNPAPTRKRSNSKYSKYLNMNVYNHPFYLNKFYY
jgi:hypothetical protein